MRPEDGRYVDAVPNPDRVGPPVLIRQDDGSHLTDADGNRAAPVIWDRLRS